MDAWGYDGEWRNNRGVKICPLTGGRVTDQYRYLCLETNCDNVKEDVWHELCGRRYRCLSEKKDIEDFLRRKEAAAEKCQRMRKSFIASTSINIEDFYNYCDEIHRELMETRQFYSKDMRLSLYREDGEKLIMCMFNGETMEEISVVENPFSYLSTRYDKLRDPSAVRGLGCCAVPSFIAEAVNVRLHLTYNMDVKSILHNDNPVYIKGRCLGGYIETVYGWKWTVPFG
ncbi:MAG: hypothetical protein IKO41_07865 [Lachnospiraceae bacterium]|nr:hypothetical protein [Lachnospiraceae bacterium]